MEEKLIEPEDRKNQSAQVKKASDQDGIKESPLAWDEPDATEFEKYAAVSELEPELLPEVVEDQDLKCSCYT